MESAAANPVVAVTIADLLNEMEAAHARMSETNPNKQLLSTAAQVIVQLAQRIAELERPARVEKPPFTLPGTGIRRWR